VNSLFKKFYDSFEELLDIAVSEWWVTTYSMNGTGMPVMLFHRLSDGCVLRWDSLILYTFSIICTEM